MFDCLDRENTGNPSKTKIFKGILSFYSTLYLDEKSSYKYWTDREEKGETLDKDQIGAKMNHYYASKFFFLWFFILGPIYAISRIINIFFPLIIVIYVYINNSWNKIDLFQWSMLVIYASFTIIVFILFIIVGKDQYYIFHILGTHGLPNGIGVDIDVDVNKQQRLRELRSIPKVRIKV